MKEALLFIPYIAGQRRNLNRIFFTLPQSDRIIERKQLKLAMFVGDSRHYRLDEIKGRHFVQTTEQAGLPGSLAKEVLEEVAHAADAAIPSVEKQLPSDFPEYIHDSVKAGLAKRLKSI